ARAPLGEGVDLVEPVHEVRHDGAVEGRDRPTDVELRDRVGVFRHEAVAWADQCRITWFTPWLYPMNPFSAWIAVDTPSIVLEPVAWRDRSCSGQRWRKKPGIPL